MTASRTFARAALLAATALLACTEDPFDARKNVYFPAPYALERIGNHIFVLSTDRDQLNVLKLDTVRDFVRAPNPIEALAIPVVDNPVGLTSDLGYDAAGAELHGPYLYAHNPALPAISVVDGRARGSAHSLTESPTHMREVVRITADGPVSAVAARAPAAADGSSLLYYGTRSGTEARLYEVSIPAGPLDGFVPTQRLVASYPAATVSALLALPRANQLVVALRDDAVGTGRTFVLQTVTTGEVTLNFPAPVRQLRTHPATPAQPEAAIWVYGLLDETSCGVAATCQGLVAVNALTGMARTVGGTAVVPIRRGSAIPTNFVLVPGGNAGATEYELLGFIGYSSGVVGAFDALTMRVLDADPSVARLESPAWADQNGTLIASLAFAADCGDAATILCGAAAAEGSVVEESILVLYRPERETVYPLDPAQPVPASFPAAAADVSACPPLRSGAADPDPQRCVFIQPGDLVRLQGGCTEELTVTTVGTDSFQTTAPSGACTGATGYKLAVGPTRPLAVFGSTTGFMGRVDLGQRFDHYSPVYGQPPGFILDAPSVSFIVMRLPEGMQPGHRLVMNARSGFSAQFYAFRTLSGSSTLDLAPTPGGMVFVVEQDAAFISFPAAGIVAEIDPKALLPNFANLVIDLYY